MLRKLIVTLGLTAIVAGCAPVNLEPAVASFNEASVGIQLDGSTMEFSSEEKKAEAIAKADKMATEICRRGPNRRSEFTSSRRIPTGQYTFVIERLYLCLR